MKWLKRAKYLVLPVVGAVFGQSLMADSAALESTLPLRERVTVDGIRAHQLALQGIADRNRDNRAAGSSGYRDSVSYVQDRLKAAGYQVALQDFPIVLSSDQSKPELSILSPEMHNFTADVDFASMSGASAEITGDIEAVDIIFPSPSANSSSSGCEVGDWKSFTKGNIALIQRGGCTFVEKAENAIKAGAKGVIIFNEGNAGRTDVLVSRIEVSKADYVVVGASFAVGERLRGQVLHGKTGVKVRLKIDVVNETRQVQNVIAETEGGDAKRVIVVGAHLDSVSAGPGMNDNGSGTATILKIAEEYAALGTAPKNKLRFIWFGAEELGLVGSEFYVRSLSAAQKSNIQAMLNFDMLGSPNYVRFVYDGDGSGFGEERIYAGPQGSAYIEKLFLDYFAEKSMPTNPTAFDGRSDYGPFIEVGIPAGGLFSGAEGRKSKRQAQIYGGTANAPFDPCYHRRCDNYDNTGESAGNLAIKSLSELSESATHAVMFLSNTSDKLRAVDEGAEDLPKPKFEYKGPMLIR